MISIFIILEDLVDPWLEYFGLSGFRGKCRLNKTPLLERQ